MSEVTRVLYVDDDPNSLELRSTLLERYGDFDVVTESDPRAALDRITRGEPIDCLLSDLEMPAMDGIEFLQSVRELDPDLPFIMFTARDTDEAVEEALDSGATDFIPKSTASLSYRLVARRIEQAVALARGESTDTDDDERTTGLAASIETAIASGNDQDKQSKTETPSREPTPCPVPGCRFEADTRADLVAHFTEQTESGGLDARLHRALENHALGSERRTIDLSGNSDRSHARSSIESAHQLARRLRHDERSRSTEQRRQNTDTRRSRREAQIAERPAPHATTRSIPGSNRQRERSEEPASRLSEDEIDAIARSLSKYLGQGIEDRDHPDSAEPTPDLDPVDPEAPAPIEFEEGEPDREARSSFELSFAFDRQKPTKSSVEDEVIDRRTLPTIDPSPGESILMGCDSQDDARSDLCHLALGTDDGVERNVLLIRYRSIDSDRLERIAEAANRLALVSVGYEQELPEELAQQVEYKTISQISDLRRLGILVTRTIEEWRSDDTEIRVCIDSLNVVLRYADAERVFRFLHLLLGKIESVGGITHSHIDPASETPRELNMLETLFDTIVTAEGERDSLLS